MTRTKSSRALLSVVLAVLMAAAFMPSLTYSSFAATAKKATKVTKVTHADKAKFTRTVGTAWTLKYKLSPSKLTSAAKKVVWKSSNSKVAKITTIKSGKAVVSFKSVGKASVTVYTKANKKAKATWNFTVVEKSATKKVAVTSAAISAKNTTVAPSSAVKVGTVLTADVAPTNATGVKYSWTVDGKEVGTDKDLTVTTDMIGKKITLKVTDDSNTAVAEQTTAAVSAVTINGVALKHATKDANGNTVYTDNATEPVYVGETLKVVGDTVDNVLNDDLTKAASVKWIRTVYSANGTAVDTTVAENQDTYTVTRADLAAKQNGSEVKIRAEVTPNANVTAYRTTAGKYTVGPLRIDGQVKVEIQANGKTAKRVEKNTKLTAVVTPSDVAGTFQWYGPNGKIAGATSAEYTPTEDGTYSVYFTPAATETVFDKSNTLSTNVKVGGTTIEKAVLGKDNGNHTEVMSAVDSVEPGTDLYVQGQFMGKSLHKTGNYTVEWFVNGKSVAKGDNVSAKFPTTDLKSGDTVYAKITGINDYLGDEITSNTVTIKTGKYLDEATVKGIKVTLDKKNKLATLTVPEDAVQKYSTVKKAGKEDAALGTDYVVKVFGSNNGLNWTEVATFNGTKFNDTPLEAAGLSATTYSMYKMQVVPVNGKILKDGEKVSDDETTNDVVTTDADNTVTLHF
ncbi:MAG: hypothetical protein LKF03_11825 [Eubacterium sp.]|nr:hypothetical protein [Eubacterium sp.]